MRKKQARIECLTSIWRMLERSDVGDNTLDSVIDKIEHLLAEDGIHKADAKDKVQ